MKKRKMIILMVLTLLSVVGEAFASRNIVGAVITPNVETCEVIRQSLIDSRIDELDVMTPCFAALGQQKFFMRLEDKGNLIQIFEAHGNLETARCEALVGAFATTPFNVSGPNAISGRCVSTGISGQSRVVAQFDRLPRYDVAMPMRSQADCQRARSALIAYGFAIELQPRDCRPLYAGGQETPVALDLYIADPAEAKVLVGYAELPLADCQQGLAALQAGAGWVNRNSDRLAFTGICSAEKNGSVLVLTSKPFHL